MQLIFRAELLAATPEQDAARKRKLYAEDREFIGRMDKGSSCVVRSSERLHAVMESLFRRGKRMMCMHVNRLAFQTFEHELTCEAANAFLAAGRSLSVIAYEPISAPEGSVLAQILAHPNVCASMQSAAVREGVPY